MVKKVPVLGIDTPSKEIIDAGCSMISVMPSNKLRHCSVRRIRVVCLFVGGGEGGLIYDTAEETPCCVNITGNKQH